MVSFSVNYKITIVIHEHIGNPKIQTHRHIKQSWTYNEPAHY